MIFTRRDHLKGLVALGAGALLPSIDAPVPARGIGHRIRHISYSDQGGRPDGVQVMLNRRHVYVGHMFSHGVTVLDAVAEHVADVDVPAVEHHLDAVGPSALVAIRDVTDAVADATRGHRGVDARQKRTGAERDEALEMIAAGEDHDRQTASLKACTT